MSTVINFHDVAELLLSEPRPFVSQGEVCWTRRIVITDGTGHAQQITLFAGSREALQTSIDKPLDAAQTAAYAEGRKDEREEWEALRAQMLEALQAVVSVADRKTGEFDRARAAIAAATGEQR